MVSTATSLSIPIVTVWGLVVPFKPEKSLDNHLESFDVRNVAMYPASNDEVATHICFLYQQLTALPATKKKYTLVDFLVLRNLPLSESVYPLRASGVEPSYVIPRSFAQFT